MTPARLHAMMDTDAWMRGGGESQGASGPVSRNPAVDLAELVGLGM